MGALSAAIRRAAAKQHVELPVSGFELDRCRNKWPGVLLRFLVSSLSLPSAMRSLLPGKACKGQCELGFSRSIGR